MRSPINAQETPPPHRVYGASESGEWIASRLGGGGYWLDTHQGVRDDVWYVWSDVGGLYRSEDDAATWSALHQNLPDGQGDVACMRDFYEHPDDPDLLVILTGTRWRPTGGVWLSRDAGRTWSKRLTDDFWANSEGRELGDTLVADPTNPDRLLAAGQGGVYLSADAGESWTRAQFDTPVNPVAVAFHPSRAGRVLLSSRAIDTWNHGKPFAASDGVFQSDDGGQTWERIAEVSPNDLVPGKRAGLWAAAFDEGPRVSRDGGATWRAAVDGLPGTPWDGDPHIDPKRVNGLFRDAAGLLAVTAVGDVARWQSGDRAWRIARRSRVTAPGWWYGNRGDQPGWVHFGKAASSIRVDRRDPRRWLMTDWYAVWETRDAGRTWRFAADGLENTVLHGVIIDPADPRHVLVCMGDNGMFHSTDGGVTLTRNQMPGERLQSNVRQVAFAPSEPSRVWAIGNTRPGEWESSSLATSEDSGWTWRYPACHGLPSDLGADRRLAALAVSPTKAKHAWVAVSGDVTEGGGGVYATRDGGESWSWTSTGLPRETPLFTTNIWDRGPELACGLDGTLVAVSKSAAGVLRRLPSEAGWQRVLDAPGRPEGVVADPHESGRWWLACGEAGLFVSDDNARAWRRVADQHAAEVACDPKSPGRVAFASDDGVRVSDDSGATWRFVTDGAPHRWRPTLAIAGEAIVIGTKGNGVFVRRGRSDQ